MSEYRSLYRNIGMETVGLPTHNHSRVKNRKPIFTVAIALLTLGVADICIAENFSGVPESALITSPLKSIHSWWKGDSMSADCMGLASPLQNNGFTIRGTVREISFGQLSGGVPNVRQVNWVNEEELGADYDFGTKLGLEGLIAESNWRYRSVNGSQNTAWVANAAGGGGYMFSPSKDNTGLGMRIMTQFLQWSSDRSDDPRFRIKAGWINPYEDFFRQPEDWFFENNALSGYKGISAVSPGQGAIYDHCPNGAPLYNTVAPIPWSSSYAAWGGELRMKPSATTYVITALTGAQAGYNGNQTFVTTPVNVYPFTPVAPQYAGQLKSGQYTYTTVNPNGSPRTGSTTGSVTPYNNHGFNFQGTSSYQGGYTGLYSVNEIGWTPILGPERLNGKYAMGAILYGQNYTKLSGPYQNIGGQNYALNQCNVAWDLYFQADQRLTSIHTSSRPLDPLYKDHTAPAKITSDSTRGLYFSSSFVVAPPYQSTLPYYFQTGFTFHGPMDARPNDTVGIALGCGFYSSTYNSYVKNVLNGPGSNATAGYKPIPNFTSTQVLEAFYNIQLNQWLQFRPDAQYIINPFGNGTVGNDWVIGAELMAKF